MRRSVVPLGEKIGHLTLLRVVMRNGRTWVRAQCDCPDRTVVLVQYQKLRRLIEPTRSCGHLKKEAGTNLTKIRREKYSAEQQSEWTRVAAERGGAATAAKYEALGWEHSQGMLNLDKWNKTSTLEQRSAKAKEGASKISLERRREIASIGGKAGAVKASARLTRLHTTLEFREKIARGQAAKPTWPEALFYGHVFSDESISRDFFAQQEFGKYIDDEDRSRPDGMWRKIIMELDGGGHHAHEDHHEDDRRKDEFRRSKGFTVIRAEDENLLWLRFLNAIAALG